MAYRAAELATKYRNKFGKDILVNLICFRKHGHNELDDPTFTNPLMYKKILSRPTVPNKYESELMGNEEFQKEKKTIENELAEFRALLDKSLEQVNNSTYKIEQRNTYLSKQWSSIRAPSEKERTYWNTGFNLQMLKEIGVKSTKYPDGFVCLFRYLINVEIDIFK